MNIVRMCMIVGMSWLLVAQAGAHAMESKGPNKAKKSMRELVMEYLPYVGYAGTVLGICGTWHGHYIAKSAFVSFQEQIKTTENFESERGLIFDRLGTALSWLLSKKELIFACYKIEGASETEKFCIHPTLVEYIKQYTIEGLDQTENLKWFEGEDS